jgi:uncharacterized protein (DUF4213/DUF364 family)
MPLIDVLCNELRGRAEQTTVATLTIGLGYTAVETTSGDVGLSYTMAEPSARCTRVPEYRDHEGRPASELLDLLPSDHSLERSIGLATVNALNRRAALALPVDDDDDGFVRAFGVGKGTRVAMIGFFGPVIARLQNLGADLRVLDRDRGMGDHRQFLATLESWPELLVITATTILSDSFERFLQAVGRDVNVVVLGPSTPMVPAAYHGLPVHRLGGMVPVDGPRAIAAARQGGGTPQLSPFCRKVSYVFDRTEV